jgi:hypothetical protein
MTGEPAKKALMKSEDRKSDLALLRDLIADHGLSADEADAFGDMKDRLDNGTFATLSDKQRQWAQDAADRLGIAYTRRSAEQAANVPKGREVAVPDVLNQDSLRAALAARRR